MLRAMSDFLLLFDLDGTLVDSLPDLTNALNEALRERGHARLLPQEVRPMIGDGMAMLLARGFAARDGDRAEAEAMHGRFTEIYEASATDNSHPYPGVAETLAALRAKPSIDLACAYDGNGRLFAEARRLEGGARCPEPAPGDLDEMTAGAVRMARPVTLGGRRIGTIYVLGNLDEVSQRLRIQILAVIAGMVIATVAAFFITRRLRDIIAKPIGTLAETAAAISRTRATPLTRSASSRSTRIRAITSRRSTSETSRGRGRTKVCSSRTIRAASWVEAMMKIASALRAAKSRPHSEAPAWNSTGVRCGEGSARCGPGTSG